MRLEIRQMVHGDVPELKTLLGLEDQLTGVPELAYVACQDQQIVGVIGYHETKIDLVNKGLELTRLFVAPAYRHRGIAGKMLVHTLALAKHHGYIEVNLHDACHYLERLCPVAEKNGKLQLNEKVEYDYACYAASADLKQERREQQ